MTKARENSDYTGLAADIVAGDTAARAGRKNLIINGRLGSDTMVNQRGFTSGTLADDAYGFDRWMSKSGASSITLNASNITLTSGKLVQIIENPFISGESVTVSASVSSGTLTGRLGTTDAFQTLPFTTTASSGDIRLELVGNGSVFTNVQLELGSVATDFEHKSYGEILADCQRYCAAWQGSGSPLGNGGAINASGSRSFLGFGNAHNPSNPVTWLDLPVVMRGTPTLTFSAAGDFIFDRGWAASATYTGIATQTLRSNYKTIGLIGSTTGLNNGDAGSLSFNNTAAYMILEAEL